LVNERVISVDEGFAREMPDDINTCEPEQRRFLRCARDLAGEVDCGYELDFPS
jgi:hypothetical protein